MTLPDFTKDATMLQTKSKNIDIGSALRECIWRAIEENRLTCGLFECAKLLKCNPDSVMLCVLPEVTGQHDVTVDIHHTLIAAFCCENGIRLLKVKQQSSLGQILDGRHKNEEEFENGTVAISKVKEAMSKVNNKSTMKSTCILLEHPKNGQSQVEVEVVDFYNCVMLGDTYPKPIIEFPE